MNSTLLVIIGFILIVVIITKLVYKNIHSVKKQSYDTFDFHLKNTDCYNKFLNNKASFLQAYAFLNDLKADGYNSALIHRNIFILLSFFDDLHNLFDNIELLDQTQLVLSTKAIMNRVEEDMNTNTISTTKHNEEKIKVLKSMNLYLKSIYDNIDSKVMHM